MKSNKYKMMNINKIGVITLILFFSIQFGNAQDIIYLTSGDKIEAKIIEVNIDFIKYKKFSNLEGPLYEINKDDIQLLLYENGESEMFSTSQNKNNHSQSIDELKTYIVENINSNGYWHNSNYKKFKASFEDSYLRLVLPEGSGQISHEGILLDFSNVYRFGKIDKRGNGVTFLNIWVVRLTNRYNEKYKFVLRVKGYNNADNLYNALKDYNKLLLQNNK